MLILDEHCVNADFFFENIHDIKMKEKNSKTKYCMLSDKHALSLG